MRSWYTIRARDDGAEVAIYDEIGAFGVSAKTFLEELGALPGDVPLTLRLNSPGGSVFDAVAIHNALARHPGGVTVWIDGIAASAASYVAMAGREIVMPENAFLMLHDPAGMVMGSAADMRAMAEALDKIKTSLVAGYATKSGGAQDDIAALMARETWLDAREAEALGFADRIAEPVRIAARFDIGRFRNAPPALVEAVAPEGPDEAGADGDAASDEAETEAGDDDPADLPAGHVGPANMPPPPDPAPPAPAAIRAEAVAEARAVLDLCTLAGRPEMASGFLEAGTPLAEIRQRLLAARAEAEPEISASHPQPGHAAAAKPWGDVIARTFRRKG